MKCIDFDKKFQYVLEAWMRDHAKDYKTYDEMESHVDDVYQAFLAAPADWLSGAKPGEYFTQFTDAKALVNWMEDYVKQHVPVPDMLLNRIGELGLESEPALVNCLRKERTPDEARMLAVNLLQEIGSTAPVDFYLDRIVNETDGDDELLDAMRDHLFSLGELVVDKARMRVDEATEQGQLSLLDLIAPHHSDAHLVDIALNLLRKKAKPVALTAAILGNLQDERALPDLIAVAADEATPYLDYIELRNAIERLGGEAPEREFDEDDPEYNAMRDMEADMLKKDEERHNH